MKPLQSLRIAVTMPPYSWFGGVDYNFATEMAEELRQLGATIFEVDTTPFIRRNEIAINDAVASLRRFSPDAALSLPFAAYALLCRTVDRQNLFTEILQIPTVMLWDHGLLQFPKVALDPLPDGPVNAATGAVARVRKVIDHPLFAHYSPDRGHIAALAKVGMIDAPKVRFALQSAFANFVRYGYRSAPGNVLRTRVAFAGNVYLDASETLPFRRQEFFASLDARIFEAKKKHPTLCLWDVIQEEISHLDDATRRTYGLHPDSTFFWRFAYDEIEFVGNTEARLSILTGLRQPYDFFGNFIEPATAPVLKNKYNITFRKSLDYFTELPLLFMNSEVIVDVVNSGFNSGVSAKIMGCLACGGLILFDYKQDFYDCMGDLGAEVMYRSVDELNALVDKYLANPRRRRDVARYLQHRVCTEFTFGELCRKIFTEDLASRSTKAIA